MLASSLYRKTMKQKTNTYTKTDCVYEHSCTCSHCCGHINNEKAKKCGHKIDHNSSSRPPFDIKSSALDKMFHARVAGDSFKA